jgi:hypothetical protein
MKNPIKNPMTALLAVLFTTVFVGSQAFAVLEVGESGEVTGQGMNRVGLVPQVKTSNGGGANISAFFDSGLNDSTSARLWAGTGDTDFDLGGSLKWVPIPDYENQPALGLRGSAFYLRDGSVSSSVLRVEPLISKKFDVDIGELTPYASLPLMVQTRDSSSTTEMQLTVGSEYVHPDVKKLRFGAELGFDLKDSFSYIAAYVSIALDDLTRGH